MGISAGNFIDVAPQHQSIGFLLKKAASSATSPRKRKGDRQQQHAPLQLENVDESVLAQLPCEIRDEVRSALAQNRRKRQKRLKPLQKHFEMAAKEKGEDKKALSASTMKRKVLRSNGPLMQ